MDFGTHRIGLFRSFKLKIQEQQGEDGAVRRERWIRCRVCATDEQKVDILLRFHMEPRAVKPVKRAIERNNNDQEAKEWQKLSTKQLQQEQIYGTKELMRGND